MAFVAGATKAAQVGLTGAQFARGISTEITGYDFVGLFTKIIFFQVIALAIAKYIEMVAGASNIFTGLARLLGFSIPAFLPQEVIDFYTNGWNGIKYWDVVKLGTVLIVVMELSRYERAQKALGGEPSPGTQALFYLIISFFLIITLPEMIQRIREANTLEHDLPEFTL